MSPKRCPSVPTWLIGITNTMVCSNTAFVIAIEIVLEEQPAELGDS